jgi:hypothetical protein
VYVSLETLQRAVRLVDSLAELDDPASFVGIALPGLATLASGIQREWRIRPMPIAAWS